MVLRTFNADSKISRPEIEITRASLVLQERARLRETLFFLRSDEKRRIDYILAYHETEDANKQEKREIFERNLVKAGLVLEPEPASVSLCLDFVLTSIVVLFTF
jgi:hypothetical protein